MGGLERWDRRNQDWAAASVRDPDRRSGVRLIAAIGVLYAVAAAVGAVLGEWVVAAVSAIKAQVFLTVALFVEQRVRRRRARAQPP
jgi:hypothetical protein